MRCPHPISIRNPLVDSTCVLAPGSLNEFVTVAGELIPGRIEVPCGRCVVCQENRRNDWATRMELESRAAAATYFITLTYNDEFYPGELRLHDLQKFFKRLRSKISCRYFACGEYGERFGRGHYHAIIWLSTPLDISHFSKILDDVWKFGFFEVREADRNAFRYVAKYTIKMIHHTPSGCQEPFAVMSRRPGISFEYFKSIKDFEHSYISLANGQAVALPRYNLEKLDPVEQVSIKRERSKVAESREQLSDIENELRVINLERSLIRKFNAKYGAKK